MIEIYMYQQPCSEHQWLKYKARPSHQAGTFGKHREKQEFIYYIPNGRLAEDVVSV